MAKRLVAVLCGAIMALGMAGIVMGTGYVVNEREKPDNETQEAHETLIKRERKTGWASIGAGVGVIAAGGAIYGIVADIMTQLDTIRKAVTGR